MGLDITMKITGNGDSEKSFRKVNLLIPWVERTLGVTVEDCEEYELTKKEVESLLADVDTVIADISKAPELLPTREGFFFGSTKYGDWYKQDLEQIKTDVGDLVHHMAPDDTVTFWAWW